MKVNFSPIQMNFAMLGSVRQSLKQSMLAQKVDASSIAQLPNGSSPPKGHVNPFEDPYLNMTGKSPSEWQKIIPVNHEITEKLKNLVKEDFVKRNGMCGTGNQADKQASIVKDYIATLPGEQKLSAIYSCQQIVSWEAERLSTKIREQNPNWQYGQAFDTSILSKDFDTKI